MRDLIRNLLGRSKTGSDVNLPFEGSANERRGEQRPKPRAQQVLEGYQKLRAVVDENKSQLRGASRRSHQQKLIQQNLK